MRNSESGGEVEVVQYNLDSRGRPVVLEASAGRFLARRPGFTDPLVFKPGLRISLVGCVEGKAGGHLDGTEYTCPVVSIRKVRVLIPDIASGYPIIHFGIGIGHTFLFRVQPRRLSLEVGRPER